MSEVGFTSAADYFGATHSMGVVGVVDNAALADRLVKAGPATTAFELGIADEEGIAAGSTIISSLVLQGFQWAAPGPFGSFLAGHLVYIGGKDLLPLILADIDF